MPVKLNSTGGGSVTLTTPSTATDYTATFPANTGNVVTTGSSAVVTQTMLATNVAGNGPAFGATSAATQNVTSNVLTKLTLGTELYDTASCFSSSRFTPNVAGYYLIFGFGSGSTVEGGNRVDLAEVRLYKNGTSQPGFGTFTYAPSYLSVSSSSMHQALIYLNGTTDYVELYGRIVASGTPQFENSTNMYGFLARAA
jgi:hypothetical protein